MHINGNKLLEVVSEKDISVEKLAEMIGDNPLRLYRVMEGEEPLGRCAELALIAVLNNLPPIEKALP